MTIQAPSQAIDGATGSGSEIIANPPVSGPTDWLGGLFNNIIMPVGTGILKVKADQQIAIEAAKAQAKINQYHTADKSVGPNDPRAALAASAQTKAQRYLPSFMLTSATNSTTDAAGKVTEIKPTISGLGWAILIGLGVLGVLIIVRLFRK
jgi:hypothetical protein